MNSLKFYIILLSLLTLAIITLAQEDPIFLGHGCQNATTSTLNSTYRTNLNLLLSSLASNATPNNTIGFYNTSFGQNTDQVYGLFICRGDLSSTTVCQNCVTFATKDLVQRCPIGIASIVYYDECILRYSNRNIFSKMDQNIFFSLSMANALNITTEPQRFNNLVGATVNDLAARAASARPGAKKFAVNKTYFDAFQNIYSLAQCTPDLSSFDCNQCLSAAIAGLPNCCSSKRGGRVLFPSCYIRYEINLFYNETAVAADSPPPPPPPVALPSPPPPLSATGPEGKNNTVIIIILSVVISVMVILIISFYAFSGKRKSREKVEIAASGGSVDDEITRAESLQYNLEIIHLATDNFSEVNKLGQGGFGSVYKGTLPNGQYIAVKRLSRDSTQGEQEFKNEVLLVAKLQHKSLVRLLGFCFEQEERLLIYEFMPNLSLNNFIFDQTKRSQLDWERRYKIIEGISRGLLYLHEDSRLRIIHRDLKPSNILLDAEMNAKISDFGMARLFAGDQTQESTSRVVGTFGYMPPEYVMRGHFSVKSDIFSFGVLVLEIVSGRKRTSINEGEGGDLLTYMWENWNSGPNLDKLIDPTLRAGSRNEMLRCIHAGLLCVQENAVDRPNMASVVIMLGSYSVTLPVPQKPAFFAPSTVLPGTTSTWTESDQSRSASVPCSINEASISELYPR
uniref:Cysteine-rich receptor-like protein kinase 10 n=1 Tax=Populus davidiana TaxID=266767 RepID=A0A6M2F0M8_9ROSI